MAAGRPPWERNRQKHHAERVWVQSLFNRLWREKDGGGKKGEEKRERQRGRRDRDREREQKLAFQEGDKKRSTGWKRWEKHLSQWTGKVGGGRGLPLKGTGFPGDRPGQQIKTTAPCRAD